MEGFESPSDVAGPSSSGAAGKALYVGNLHPFTTEGMLQEIFSTLGPVGEIKIIKDKLTGLSAGYGFVQYLDHRAAEMALQSLNGRVLHGQEVRVNWAFQKDRREDSASQFQIFVGDLASDVNDKTLFDAFQSCGCTDVRVMWDHNTGRSKGYGFVSFKSRADAERALSTMSGAMLGSRRIRCGWAQHKQESAQASYAAVDRADPNNANMYIGNLAPDVTDAELRRTVAQFGAVLDVKVYRKGGYAFAQYATHAEAVRAIVGLSGQALCSKTLKCSWGRHQARRLAPMQQQPPMDSFEYLALQQQQQVAQQMSLQQQLAMQQQLYGAAAQQQQQQQAAAQQQLYGGVPGMGGALGLGPPGGAGQLPGGAAGQLGGMGLGMPSQQQQQQLQQAAAAQQQQLMQQGGGQPFLGPGGQPPLDFSNLYYSGMYYQQ